MKTMGGNVGTGVFELGREWKYHCGDDMVKGLKEEAN